MNFDPLDSCPYDPVHRILRSRMQFHLTKCSKNFPNSRKQQCPFDARHIVNEVEYKYHINTCPARESVVHYKLHDVNAFEQHKLVPIENEPAAKATEENWEDELEVKSYNPLQNIKDRNVVRTLVGAPKSERKKFRLQERLRHSALEEINHKKNKERATTSNPRGLKQTKPESDPFDEQEKPLRPLKKLPKSLDKSGIINISLDKTQDLEKTLELEKTQDLQKTQELEKTQEIAKNITKNEQLQKTSKISVIKEVDKNEIFNKSNGNVKTKEVEKTKDQKMIREEDIVFVPAIPNDLPIQNNSASKILNSSKTLNNSGYHDRSYASVVNKENVTNRSFVNCSINESIIDKLSQTVEELNVHDEETSRKAETLDKELESLKKSAPAANNSFNTSFNSRCGAQFSNSFKKY